jgi:hypothetical protein
VLDIGAPSDAIHDLGHCANGNCVVNPKGLGADDRGQRIIPRGWDHALSLGLQKSEKILLVYPSRCSHQLCALRSRPCSASR